MTTEAEYKSRIQTYDESKLRELWQVIQDRNTPPNWEAGKALEYFILRAFELEHAEVRYPYRVKISSLELGDDETTLEQIDGVVYSDGIASLIECKDGDRVDVEPIAKLSSQLKRRPSVTVASIFSIKGFTRPAMIQLERSHPQTIFAWEKDDIEFSLKTGSFRNSLQQKYRRAIEEADYNFRIEEDT